MKFSNRKAALLILSAFGILTAVACRVHTTTPSSEGFPWPPSLNERYPEIPFAKPDGSVFKMSDLKGRYVVVHYRGMTCPACQNMAQRRDLMWNDPRVMNVDVLLFNGAMKPPTAEDARLWAEKYGFQAAKNERVVSAPDWTHSRELYDTSYRMVVGGQLLDKEGVIRVSQRQLEICER